MNTFVTTYHYKNAYENASSPQFSSAKATPLKIRKTIPQPHSAAVIDLTKSKNI